MAYLGRLIWSGLLLGLLVNCALHIHCEPVPKDGTSHPPLLLKSATHEEAISSTTERIVSVTQRPPSIESVADPTPPLEQDEVIEIVAPANDGDDHDDYQKASEHDEHVVQMDEPRDLSADPLVEAETGFINEEGLASFMLPEVVSTNSGINGIPDMMVGQTIVSLVDHVPDFQPDQPNEEPIAPTVFNKTTALPSEPVINPESLQQKPTEDPADKTADVHYTPSLESQVEMINDSGGSLIEVATTPTDDTASTQTSEESQIPLFSEWAQKRMEEVEKEQEQDAANTSIQKKNQTTGQKIGTTLKIRTKNYASPDCGAKIIASNSESSNTRAVLTLTKDEYLLSPCTSRIWFVVELCEAIQAETVDLANFELFSSSPKNFSVGVGNRFPTRDWSQVGKFTALDERDIQSFDLSPHLFGKYVRVDIHSHYNSEHFCPISLFRVFGTSEFEAFETENRVSGDDDDDDEDDELEDASKKEDQNIFRSASDAVMSIVKKAAATFVKPSDNRTEDVIQLPIVQRPDKSTWCMSPRHGIVCKECSGNVTAEVSELVSCKNLMLRDLLDIGSVRHSLVQSNICTRLLGIDVSDSGNCSNEHGMASGSNRDWILQILPTRYVVALCNILASDQNLINVSSGFDRKDHKAIVSNITIDKKGESDHLITQTKNTILKPETVDPIPELLVEQFPADIVQKKETIAQPDETINVPIEVKDPPIQDSSTTFIPEDSATSVVEVPQMLTKETKVYGDLNAKDNTHGNVEEAAVDIQTLPDTLSDLSDRTLQEMADNLLNVALPATTSAPLVEPPTQPPPLDIATEELALPGGAGVITNSAGTPNQKVHSESVFLRLSNRVKSLERNMSLSGQYLEELSRRYKKQVEELQLVFSKTLLVVEEQNKRSHDREQQLFEQNEKLREDLDHLTERLYSWRTHLMYGMSLVCVQFVVWLVRRIWSGGSAAEDDADDDELSTPDSGLLTRTEKLRRKSIDGSTRSIVKSTKKVRRSSEEALHIAGTYADLMIRDDGVYEVSPDTEEYDTFYDQSGNKKKSSKQRKPVKRTVSMDNGSIRLRKNGLQRLNSSPDGYFQSIKLDHSDAESTQGSEPVLDEDYEVYVPGTDMVYNEFMPDGPSGQSTPLDTDTSQANGTPADMSQSSLSSKKSSDKLRRLSSPAFLKSPFSRSLGAGKKKKSGQGDATGWEWYRLRKDQTSSTSSQVSSNNQAKKGNKAKSESPPGALAEEELRPSSSATTLSMTSNSSTPVDKKQGSFRRILRKVF